MSLNELNLDMEVGADVAEFEPPDNSFRPIPKGVYTFTRDSSQGALEWKPMSDGNVWAQAKMVVTGGDHNGRIVFAFLSTKQFRNRKSTTVQDFLASCEYAEVPANGSRYTIGEIIDAVEQNVGPFEAYVDWEGYCANCGETTIRGSKNFPLGENGPLHKAECPECGEEVVARAVIRRYIVGEDA